MLRRYKLTDDEWNRITDLRSPENTSKQGCPRKSNRMIHNGII
jgi:transposase